MASVTITRENAVDDFVTSLKKRMAELDMTPSELARRAKIGRPYLHRVLAGQQDPSLRWADKVARCLGLKVKTVKA